MRILFVTIALDSMPFLPLIHAELRKLPKEVGWEWYIMEGVARPVGCTRWVAPIEPRLSRDGTTQYISSLMEFDGLVSHAMLADWPGKLSMVNFPLRRIGIDGSDPWEGWGGEFLLWQIDSDELWQCDQIVRMRQMFMQNPQKNAAFFWCRYFVGPDKVITTRNCFGNNSKYEWLRVWRIKPGMLFETHEPPVIRGLKLNAFTHSETEARGLVFDHMSWCTRAQVELKARYYAGPNNPNAKHYAGLVERWETFQQEKTWPRPLRQLFPWVEPHCSVSKI